MNSLKAPLKRVLIICCLMLGLVGCQKRNQQDSWHTLQARHKIVIGIDDSFVPMTFREKNGQLTGYDVALARLIFKGSGIKPDFQTIDWDMKETELNNQTIDLIWSGYSKTAQRAKKVAFSTPYLTNRQVLVSLKASKKTAKPVLGVQTGSSGAEQLQKQPTLLLDKIAKKQPILYDTYNNAFIDLQAKRIDTLLIDEVYANYELKLRANRQAFNVSQGPFQEENFAVGMRPSDFQLQKFINKRLKVLTKNGQLQQLKAKWFG